MSYAKIKAILHGGTIECELTNRDGTTCTDAIYLLGEAERGYARHVTIRERVARHFATPADRVTVTKSEV